MYLSGNSRERAANAQLLIMLATRRLAKHMQNYEYLNWARIMHVFLKAYSRRKMFSSFWQCFAEFMQ